jgi:large subunit ribosomal protein L19e
MTLTVR